MQSVQGVEHAIHAALELWKQGKVMETKQVCTQLLQDLPNEPEILYLLGHCELAVGNLQQAQTTLTKAVMANPKLMKYQELLQQVYRRIYEGHLTQAIITLKHANGATLPAADESLLRLQRNLLESYLPNQPLDISGTHYYVIGDAHCSFFAGTESLNLPASPSGIGLGVDTLKMFTTFDLGPIFAGDLGRLNTARRTREKALEFLDSGTLLSESDIILCFGELDCRVNLIPEAQKSNGQLKPVVEDCVTNYFVFVDDLITRGHRPIIWGPIPTQPDWGPYNYEFPRNGTQVERNAATKIFTDTCAAFCEEREIPFLSLFPQLVNPDGTSKYQFLVNGCHLSQRAMPLALDLFAEKGLLTTYTIAGVG
ncbi:MAG: tetratricopeptide repeat protein [Gemmataceae bacterium]